MRFVNPIPEKVSVKYSRIIEILDENTAVIDRGAEEGINVGDVFIVFGVEDIETVSPVTQKKIGYFERVKGFGIAVQLQEKQATLESANADYVNDTLFSKKANQNPYEKIPFHELEIGDFAKPVQIS